MENQMAYNKPTSNKDPIREEQSMDKHQSTNEQSLSMTQHPIQGAAKFSGKSTKDAKEWLEDIAFRFAAVDINMTTGWKKIYLYLDDQTAKWWRENHEDFGDWCGFRAAFEEEYSPSSATVRISAAKDMADRKQGKNETLTAYYQDKIRLIKIYESDMSEAMQLEWVQAGMWHTTLDEFLKQRITSTKKFKEYAIQLEAKQKLLAKIKLEQDAEENFGKQVRNVQHSDEQPRYVAPYRRDTGSYAETGSASNNQWTPQQPPMRNNGCYQCGRLGHMARDCYSQYQKNY